MSDDSFTKIVDTDVHPFVLPHEISSRLPAPWRAKFDKYGIQPPVPGIAYPRLRNGGYRADTWSDTFPGNDVGLLKEQLLDRYDMAAAVLIPLHAHSFGAEQAEFSEALSVALNDWLAERFLDADERLIGSISVPFETPVLAARRIRERARDTRFQQILAPANTELPMSSPHYWPIFEAACETGLPLGIHSGGVASYRLTGAPTYYLEEHVEFSGEMQSVAAGLILGGVFERFPSLQVVLVEGGVAWAGPFQWSMDEIYRTWHRALPGLRALPSEYFREHFWLTTQPIEEPARTDDLVTAIELAGMTQRLLFASDYPHWDFDSPEHALKGLPKAMRQAVFHENASHIYRPNLGVQA
ncbi:amidohydrolase family protein [Streptomyces sp. NPDC058773]|uniref:amidohydrolase family protein n=1 Tax=Streptomyces sp. NPDC058773 TaxID=3346632 RepID=UPI003695ABE2